MPIPDLSIIQLESTDSTNNYAMQLIDANKAQHGLTILARYQTDGKGQRGKSWLGVPGQSLLMSVIVTPFVAINEQFAFNASVAVAIAKVLQKLDGGWNIHIKWPNDIIVNDKKAGGVLIENVLRGSKWTYSVIGLGVNVLQDKMPDELPFAASLKIASGRDFEVGRLCGLIRESILNSINVLPGEIMMRHYNEYLFRKGMKQKFKDDSGQWEATILAVHTDGTLEVKRDGEIAFYHHGQVEWVWQD